MKHENYKRSKRSSSHYPNIKISINNMNNLEFDKNTDESQIDLTESLNMPKRKKVRFLTNELHVKEDYKLDKLSPPKALLKNSILKKSNTKNARIDSFFKKLAQQHQFLVLKKFNKNNNSNLSNNKNSKKDDSNTIPTIEPNKKNFKTNGGCSVRNIKEVSKENNKNHIFYPILNNNKSKKKYLPLENNIKNKFEFKNNLKTKKNNINFFSDLNKTDNKYENNKTFVNSLFPTSINEISNQNKIKTISMDPINIKEKKYNKTENNFYSHKNKISKMNLKKQLDKTKNTNRDITNTNNNYNILISKFKEYQKQIEPSFSIIKNEGNIISKDINNNPFMRKIENLNDINQFEIIFKNTIMKNIIEVQEKSKTGFFQGECSGVNANRGISGGNYICENRANIFNVSEMIDRMNPASVVKFNKLLKKDYKEFLGVNKKDYRNKKAKKKDLLRIKLIQKYHKELFYQNEIADKYNIKKNAGIKFIIENKENKNYDDIEK